VSELSRSLIERSNLPRDAPAFAFSSFPSPATADILPQHGLHYKVAWEHGPGSIWDSLNDFLRECRKAPKEILFHDAVDASFSLVIVCTNLLERLAFLSVSTDTIGVSGE
jgi:hypothetical protein